MQGGVHNSISPVNERDFLKDGIPKTLKQLHFLGEKLREVGRGERGGKNIWQL